jgi:hypothetical protein
MTTGNCVLHVVPEYQSGGIDGYVNTVAARMSEVFSTSAIRLIAGLQIGAQNTAEILSCVKDSLKLSTLLTDATKSGGRANGVILHYVGYAYQKRGCPWWLIQGIKDWRKTSKVPLIVVFHEVYAFGFPWQSSFWLTPIQRFLARELALLSDHILTSTELYRERLISVEPSCSDRILVLPICSTAGELTGQIVNWNDRPKRMIIFGSPGRRELVYRHSCEEMLEHCRRMRIKEIVDIGPPMKIPIPHTVPGIIQLGTLAGEKVSAAMREACAGYLDYPSRFLAKSTTFAAYCAHQLVPIVKGDEGMNADGLRNGIHFINHQVSRDLQPVALEAYNWYASHNSYAHAGTIQKMLTSKPAQSFV